VGWCGGIDPAVCHKWGRGYLDSLVTVLVDMEHVTVGRVGRMLFEGLSMTVADGQRVGVVGVNGTGKSTLLRVLAGKDVPDAGVVRRGRGTRIGFLDQEPELPDGTVQEAVGEGWEAEAALSRLGLGPQMGTSTVALSGGQRKRVALARLLAHPVELLVLDEPTNHLDLGAAAWLEDQLSSFRGGLVLVTHDRHLLNRLTTSVLELDRGHAYFHDGGYELYLTARSEREAQAASAEATRRNLARRELAWLRRGAQARSRKPQARVEAALRLIEGRPVPAAGTAEFQGNFGVPRLGDKVVECIGAGFRYQDGPTVLSGVDLVVGRRERLGVVGANGAGKTTLLQLLAGRIQPTEGAVETGPSVVAGYHDQLTADLDADAKVRDLVAGPYRQPGSPEDINLMKRFLFDGDLPFARVRTLSGGERRRLQILLLTASRPNVLFLDEPTNDLDLDALRALEDFLEDWPGALLVVSHDRTFLDRVTDRLVEVGPEGAVAEVPGGVAGWVDRAVGRQARLNEMPSSGVVPSKSSAASTDGAGSRSAPARPRVNPSRQARLLRDAEREMARLHGEVTRLTEAMAAASEYQEMAALGHNLADAQAALEAAEESWLALAVND
jgi:ABC transport system ATP-binding/permease protein